MGRNREAAARYGKLGREVEPDPRPERQPGDPPWRCLHCMRWRCDAPLSLCGECEAEYQSLAANMPPDKPDNYPMFQGEGECA